MVTSERENPEIDAEQTGIYTVARQYLVDLLDSPDADPRVAEANAIIAILEPLGLPANLRAAVLLYPMVRDGEIDGRTLGQKARQRILSDYDWGTALGQLLRLLGDK